jgi:hypothetical protein
MTDHDRLRLNHFGIGFTDAPGDILVELIRYPPANVVGLEAL